MRFPIKLNSSWWPSILWKNLKGAYDPRLILDKSIDHRSFSKAVSTFKIGNTFKATGEGRFPKTISAMSKIRFDHSPIILDIGASDGSTSLDVMRSIKFTEYYVTDLNLFVYYIIQGKWVYFYQHDGEPLLAVSDLWVIYCDLKDANLFFKLCIKNIINNFPVYNNNNNNNNNKLLLLSKKITNGFDNRIKYKNYNIFDFWEHGKVDIVIIANLLNTAYFKTEEIKCALLNVKRFLKSTGIIVLIDNRTNENSSIIKVANESANVEYRIGIGSDIEDIAISVLTS